ncbi:MAG TPA: hypothetical protein VIM11_22515 [Tepidisphaeraceae bacterium]|jgi:hypothetical protein
MKTYEITFTIDNKRYAETVHATSSSDARRLIEARYPRCVIWNVREQ